MGKDICPKLTIYLSAPGRIWQVQATLNGGVRLGILRGGTGVV